MEEGVRGKGEGCFSVRSDLMGAPWLELGDVPPFSLPFLTPTSAGCGLAFRRVGSRRNPRIRDGDHFSSFGYWGVCVCVWRTGREKGEELELLEQ